MDVREKLVELLGRVQQMGVIYRENQMDERYPTIEQIRNTEVAARLIAHGVTVQEWIPVKDRLPEAGGYVVCIAKRNPFSRFMPMVARIEKNGWVNPITEQYISEVTHWMPLPPFPKGWNMQ